METYRIEVGSAHGVKPGNIVGAIANEAGLDGALIGRVDIREDHSFVDLPEGMPKPIYKDLQKARIGGRELRISRVKAPRGEAPARWAPPAPPVRPPQKPKSRPVLHRKGAKKRPGKS